MEKQTKRAVIAFVIFILVLAAITAALWLPFQNLFENRIEFREFIQGFGVISPIMFIALVTVQVVVAPVPGPVVGVLSGFIFGPWFGTLWSMVGVTLGSIIAFGLARKFGRPLVERVVSNHHIRKVDEWVSGKRAEWSLFILFLLPALPDDALCFVSGGLTRINWHRFLVIVIIGRFPGFLVLNIAGAGIAERFSPLYLGVLAAAALISIILFLFRARIEKFFSDLLQKKPDN